MKNINYKGKGEHSVRELELVIENALEELHLIKSGTKQFSPIAVGYCAISMGDILNEAIRRKAKHSLQYADYSLSTWTVSSDLLEHRKKALLDDGSIRKIRIEYEM